MKIQIALAASLAFAVPVAADVTIEYEASSTGYRGMGATASKGTRSFAGLRSREETNTRFTGSVLGKLGGKKGKDTVQILRVDLDKRWDIDPRKKSYREAPIALPPPQPGADEEESGSSRPSRDEKPTHRIKSAKADVKKTGESRTINGFKAARHVARLSITIEEIETKQTAEYRMASEIWATPWTKELRQATEEESRFQQAYARKLGADLPPQERGRYGIDTATMLLAATGPEVEKAVSKLAREAGKIEGYAVLTETSWHSPAPPAAAKGKAAEEDEGSALDAAAGADSLGGAALGLIGGFAKKKAKKKASEAMAPKAGAPAFSVRTEVKKVKVSALAADVFEVPEGYKEKS